jgi:putative transcriptional regulator
MTTRGRLLVAAPGLTEESFHRAVILVVEHTDDGALGVALNRPGGVPIGEILEGWEPVATSPAVMYVGGPVERDAILALGAHRDPEGATEAGTTIVIGTIGVVDLSRDPDDVAAELTGLRLFSGYAGWSPGQLDAELDAGGWLVVDAEPGDVLTDRSASLWRTVLGRQGDPALRRLALYPADVSAN